MKKEMIKNRINRINDKIMDIVDLSDMRPEGEYSIPEFFDRYNLLTASLNIMKYDDSSKLNIVLPDSQEVYGYTFSMIDRKMCMRVDNGFGVVMDQFFDDYDVFETTIIATLMTPMVVKASFRTKSGELISLNSCSDYNIEVDYEDDDLEEPEFVD